MMTETQMVSDLAIPPGEYLEEVLGDKGISQAELARRMGRPSQTVNEIIKGEKAITPETSIQLEKVLGVKAYLWTSLESEYRLIKAIQVEAEQAKKEESIINSFPYLELSKLDLVEQTRDPLTKVQNLRRFFGVASLFNLKTIKECSPAFRQSQNNNINHHAIAAWLRSGAILSEKIKCEAYNKASLLSNMENVRKLTREDEPEKFMPKLEEILARCGIALVVIPHFKRTYTTGATFWVKQDKALLMLSLRGSWADIFWFSLFHELGHIILHNRRVTFLENKETSDPQFKKQEDEADEFAQQILIPHKKFSEFKNQGVFNSSSISEFASEIGIAKGVVTGRLQHEKILPYTSNIGRIRYEWE